MNAKNKSLEKARRTLNVPGVRITSQRALILDIIRQGRGHLDADEIYHQARKKQPRLSLSTVYRTLQTFKSLGLIEELHFDEAHHHYEVKPSTAHHHLVCLGCGQVVEFQCPLASPVSSRGTEFQCPLVPLVKRNVAEAKDFEIIGTELRMTGYCSRCRQRRE